MSNNKNNLFFEYTRDISKLWAEGWRLATPYLAKTNGMMALAAGAGIFAGSMYHRFKRDDKVDNSADKNIQ